MTGCPLCDGWCGELDLGQGYELCEQHTAFVVQLDEFLTANRVALGRLSDRTRIEFARSIQEMQRGEGITIDPKELREP